MGLNLVLTSAGIMTEKWMLEVLKGLVLHIEPIKQICELGVPFTEVINFLSASSDISLL